jgi:hypothetical protein
MTGIMKRVRSLVNEYVGTKKLVRNEKRVT